MKNIDNNTSELDIRLFFKDYNIEKVKLIFQNNKYNKAFIQFKQKDVIKNVLSSLNSKTLLQKKVEIVRMNYNTISKNPPIVESPLSFLFGNSKKEDSNLTQPYDYLIVIDFEATCDDRVFPDVNCVF